MFLTGKLYHEAGQDDSPTFYMKTEERQNLIEKSVDGEVSRKLL